jgi:DNA-directed RNA polymerase subunit RPC12/RpoP
MDNPILDEMPEAYISQSGAQGEQPELTLVECSDCGATTDNVDVDGTYICSCGHKGKWKPSYPAQKSELQQAVGGEKEVR